MKKLIALISLVLPMLTYAKNFERIKEKAKEAANITYRQVLENSSAAEIQKFWRGVKTRKQFDEIQQLLEKMSCLQKKNTI